MMSKCEWCGEETPTLEPQVVSKEWAHWGEPSTAGQTLQVCARCARELRGPAGVVEGP
jgi:hypothetical protein